MEMNTTALYLQWRASKPTVVQHFLYHDHIFFFFSGGCGFCNKLSTLHLIAGNAVVGSSKHTYIHIYEYIDPLLNSSSDWTRHFSKIYFLIWCLMMVQYNFIWVRSSHCVGLTAQHLVGATIPVSAFYLGLMGALRMWIWTSIKLHEDMSGQTFSGPTFSFHFLLNTPHDATTSEMALRRWQARVYFPSDVTSFRCFVANLLQL